MFHHYTIKEIMNNEESISTPSSEDLNNLENDAVWALLDEASTTEASPLFAQKVMQEIRAEESEDVAKVVIAPSFWNRYSKPIYALGAAGIAACVIAMLSTTAPMNSGIDQLANDDSVEQLISDDADLAAFEEDLFFDEIASEMIALEHEDPIFMSEDDINYLVSM